MKTLLIMRHAKSSMDEKVEDRARPLSKRGKKNAERMGELLKDEKIKPDTILISNAERTRQTADLMIEAMNYQGDRYYLTRLYMAEVDVYVREIQCLNDEANVVMIIGHNPALETLLQITTGKVESLPTAAIAEIRLPIDTWRAFDLETPTELVNFWRPKEL